MSEMKKAKILTAARAVFLRYGYRRVSMNDIAEAACVSRPALYILFKNKEEIFIGVFLQWVEETLAAVKKAMEAVEAPERKLMCAFELWTVHPFEMIMASPEAKELIDGSFDFAKISLEQGYTSFETAIAPVVALLAGRGRVKTHLAPEEIAHVLASATRGFKQSSVNAAELRLLIEKLLVLSFSLDKGAFSQPGKVRRSV